MPSRPASPLRPQRQAGSTDTCAPLIRHHFALFPSWSAPLRVCELCTCYYCQPHPLSVARLSRSSYFASSPVCVQAFDSVLATEARTEGMLIFDIPLEPAPAVTAPAPAGRSTAIAAPAVRVS